MIVKDEFLNKLRQHFGLNLYEVRIWAALLSRGVSTAGELSDIGDVPRSRAYDVLESLEKKGFVIMKLGKPIKYLAVDPNEVVDRVKKNVKIEADDSIGKLEDLKKTEVMDELSLLHKQGVEFVEVTDLSGAIKGRHNIYLHLESMIKGAQNSLSLMTSSKGLMRKLDALKPELEKLAKKGVSIRIAAPILKDTVPIIKGLNKNIQIRNLKNMDARFCVIDDKEIMFMVLNDEEVHPAYDMGIWINTPYFAKTLKTMFDKSWSKLDSADKVISKFK